jgi:hypothetical protein
MSQKSHLDLVPPLGEGPSRRGISLRSHNILDYVMGLALIATPGLFGFASINSARNVCFNLGFALLGYSLLTDYKLSLFKLIPLRIHMVFDTLVGIAIAFAPWVIGYRESLSTPQFVAHWVLGVLMMGLVYVTRTRSERSVAAEDREEFREAA